MGRGGYKTGGWAHEILPLRKDGGGAEKVLAMLKGGTKSFEVALTRELEVLAIVMGGGAEYFRPSIGEEGAQKD